MSEHQDSRTLLKSPPELWTECSDAQSLARHLGESVGEIKITRLEPETTVAWEGDRISGTVRLEPSGWGTKVTLTVSAEAEAAAAAEPAPPPEPEPIVSAAAEIQPARAGFVARMRRWFGSEPISVTEPPGSVAPPVTPVPPAPPAPPAPDPAPEPIDLTATLDSLGKAHHRPFSRA